MPSIAVVLHMLFVPCNAVQHTEPNAHEPRNGFLLLISSDFISPPMLLDSIYAHQAEHVALTSVVVRHIRQLANTGDRFLPFGVRPLGTLSPNKFATFAQLTQDVEAPVTCRGTVVNMWWRFKKAYEAGILPISALRDVHDVYKESASDVCARGGCPGATEGEG
jgi:hypothetical protein